jgi:hypothetical protein
MIKSCDYCFAVFDDNYWTWCRLSNEDDNTFVTLCSECAAEILRNQKDSISIRKEEIIIGIGGIDPPPWELIPENEIKTNEWIKEKTAIKNP